LLSLPEVRAALIKAEPLNLAKDANWSGKKKEKDDYLDYMSKNLVRLECPLESAFGYESRRTKKSYVELIPLNTAPKSASSRVVYDPDVFWAKPPDGV
jgi:hypothetical protein